MIVRHAECGCMWVKYGGYISVGERPGVVHTPIETLHTTRLVLYWMQICDNNQMNTCSAYTKNLSIILMQHCVPESGSSLDAQKGGVRCTIENSPKTYESHIFLYSQSTYTCAHISGSRSVISPSVLYSYSPDS